MYIKCARSDFNANYVAVAADLIELGFGVLTIQVLGNVGFAMSTQIFDS